MAPLGGRKKRSTRHKQLAAVNGMGTAYRSPTKKRDKHNARRVAPLGQKHESSALWAQLAALQAAGPGPSAAEQVLDAPLGSTSDVQTTAEIATEPSEDGNTADWEDMEASVPVIPVPPSPPHAPGPVQAKALQAYLSWTSLLPRLTEPLASFRRASRRQVPPLAPASIQHTCTGSCTQTTTLMILCLYISRMRSL
jgi:hypothetical protein